MRLDRISMGCGVVGAVTIGSGVVALTQPTMGFESSQLIAQARVQTVAECVRELNAAYPYRVESIQHFNHVQVCQNTLSSQPPTESLGSCVSGLNQVYPYRVETTTNNRHQEICARLLQAQQNNANQQRQMPAQNPYPYPYPYPYPALPGGNPYPALPGGSPQAISQCMRNLLYERRPVCTRSYCAQLGSPAENANNNFGGWQWQTVRTETSESAAAQACQNAR